MMRENGDNLLYGSAHNDGFPPRIRRTGVRTVYYSTRNPSLARAELNRVRPTQFTVGRMEVERKAHAGAALGNGKPPAPGGAPKWR
jgi:hypothetical protein